MRPVLFHLISFIFSFTLVYENEILAQNSTATIVANDDISLFYRNQPVEIDVLYNDYGFGDPIKVMKISISPKYGSAKVTPNNTIIYTPRLNFLGDDVFEYIICGNDGSCDNALVFIYVAEYDYQPIAQNDSVTYINDPRKNVEIAILQNDLYIWDEPLAVYILQELVNGKVQVNSNNTITPTFKENFIGYDSLSYKVVDREGDSDTAMVFLYVKPKEVVFGAEVPNGFSPNSDGVNDIFNIPELDSYDDLEISIFNQSGGLIYEDKAYQNNWNGISNMGKYSGMDLPSGTYYYLLQVKGTDTKITGYIYLSR